MCQMSREVLMGHVSKEKQVVSVAWVKCFRWARGVKFTRCVRRVRWVT